MRKRRRRDDEDEPKNMTTPSTQFPALKTSLDLPNSEKKKKSLLRIVLAHTVRKKVTCNINTMTLRLTQLSKSFQKESYLSKLRWLLYLRVVQHSFDDYRYGSTYNGLLWCVSRDQHLSFLSPGRVNILADGDVMCICAIHCCNGETTTTF